jgi:FKBP-type peptidyl-prolyl cis-trans isomerase SlpA
MAVVKEGHEVTFRCSSFLEDGSCLDEAEDQKPLTMKAGRKLSEPIPKAIGKALIGMGEKETKIVKVPPDLSFGEPDPKKIFALEIAQDDEYTVGEEIQLKVAGKNGDQVVNGIIASLKGGVAQVDTNHPLAGKTLVLKIEVLSIKQ